MELYFKVKAQDDLEAKRIARNMAIETLRNKGMMGRWFEVQNVEWIQKGLFGDGVLAKVHVYVKDKKTMKDNQYKKIKAFLAQEFKDVKAMLKKKSFKDASSSEYDGMDLSEMKQLRSELMRKQERERAGSDKFREYQKQISELTRYINRFKDANPPKFEESKHKRDKDGKFSSTGGGGTSAKESGTSGRKSVSEMSKSKNKAEQKKVAKAYWVHFLSGVDDLVDFAGENEELAYYAEEGDIDSMASMLGSSKGGIETALEAIEEYDTDELKQLEKILNNDSAIKDARIELRMGGRTIGYIEADTLSEAVRRYEEEHPEARGKVNAYMADWSRDAMTRLIDQGYTPREAALRDPDYQSNGTPAMLNEMISFGERYMRTKREEKRRNRE